MSRGRPPQKGIDLALPVAKGRGRVMEIVQNGDTPATIIIVADNRVHFITILRADPFRVTPAEMEAENTGVLAQVRTLPGSVDIVRELWPYSRSGTLRFFRVEDSWLLEIGRDGKPLADDAELPRVERAGGNGGNGKT